MKEKVAFIRYLILSFLVLSISSCNEELILLDNQNDSMADFGIEVVRLKSDNLRSSNGVEDEYVIKFKDEDTYVKTMMQLDSKTEQERLDWLSNLADFESLLLIYNQAMDEASELDFTEEEYNAFKKKYKNHLYFPEYEEDYGAYLPVLDEVQATILNTNGHLLIGDKLIEADMITSYEDLQKSGRAYYAAPKEEEKGSVAEVSNSTRFISNNTVRAYDLAIVGGISSSFTKVGREEYEFVKDWTRVGNGKKIRITFGRIYRNRSGNYPQLCWHSEVSFRKKGFLGRWYNYSSETTFSATIYYLGTNLIGRGCYIASKGSSSHDGYWNAVYIQLYGYNVVNIDGRPLANTNHLRLYFFPGYAVKMTVTYRGMPEPMTMWDSKSDVYGYTNSWYGIQ